MRRQKQRKNKIPPKEFMCINGDMHVTTIGQFILKEDYYHLLKRYKHLLRLARARKIFERTKQCKLFDMQDYAEAA